MIRTLSLLALVLVPVMAYSATVTQTVSVDSCGAGNNRYDAELSRLTPSGAVIQVQFLSTTYAPGSEPGLGGQVPFDFDWSTPAGDSYFEDSWCCMDTGSPCGGPPNESQQGVYRTSFAADSTHDGIVGGPDFILVSDQYGDGNPLYPPVPGQNLWQCPLALPIGP